MKHTDFEEYERRMVFAREQAAQAWTTPLTEYKVMDVDLANAFAAILCPIMYAPHLGCASTEQLIDELKARLIKSFLLSPQYDEDDTQFDILMNFIDFLCQRADDI